MEAARIRVCAGLGELVLEGLAGFDLARVEGAIVGLDGVIVIAVVGPDNGVADGDADARGGKAAIGDGDISVGFGRGGADEQRQRRDEQQP